MPGKCYTVNNYLSVAFHQKDPRINSSFIYREAFQHFVEREFFENAKHGKQDKEDIMIICNVNGLAKQFFKEQTIVWYGLHTSSKASLENLIKINAIHTVNVFQRWEEAL